MRAYCDFYQVAPEDQALLELSQALLADPQREGLQLLARDDAGRAVGFATLYWTWQTLAAARVGVMNDLYVASEARGTGVAAGLIAACLERCREHAATWLLWQTAVDNHRAQAVYERIGATARTAGWTTSYRSIPADRWQPRDGRPIVKVVRGRRTSLAPATFVPRSAHRGHPDRPPGAVLPPTWKV